MIKVFIVGIIFAIVGGLYSTELYNMFPVFWEYVKGLIVCLLAFIMFIMFALFILATYR